MSKEERSEWKHKLENMEENDNFLEVKISFMKNLLTEIPNAANQPPLEQFEDKPMRYFYEAMM